MHKYKKTFVLGAGASFEVGLPVGTGLRDDIAKLLNITFEMGHNQRTGDQICMDAIRSATKFPLLNEKDPNKFLRACWRIRDALPQSISIDNLIDTHRGNLILEACGKIGIARAILKAERASKLHHDESRVPAPSLTRVADAWLTPFFQLLSENCPVSELESRLATIAFIVFNYDRCLEQFLLFSFQNVYEIDTAKATELVRKMTILRPYGSVGALPNLSNRQALKFGDEPSGASLFELSRGIKTFTEGVDPAHSEIAAIREAAMSTQTLVFLGSAFHPANIDLLFPELTEEPKCRPSIVYSTGRGLSDPAVDDIHANLTRRVSGRVEIAKGATCFEFFGRYWRQLSMTK